MSQVDDYQFYAKINTYSFKNCYDFSVFTKGRNFEYQ